jgi:hypothetical protein
MKKPTLETVLAKKAPAPAPEPAPQPAAKAKPDDGKMTTSLRIRPEMLTELKILAMQKRVRVNDVILEAIRNHLAVHGRGDTAEARWKGVA